MFYEVVYVTYRYPMGVCVEELNHQAYFEELENAYFYCVEENAGTGNDIPSYEEVARELQEVGDQTDVGYLTIFVRSFQEYEAN